MGGSASIRMPLEGEEKFCGGAHAGHAGFGCGKIPDVREGLCGVAKKEVRAQAGVMAESAVEGGAVAWRR